MDADALSNLLTAVYTRFVLRDFVGKIIPASVLIGAILLAFATPLTILRELRRQRLVALALFAGVAWIIGLAMQNLGETTYLWQYFPTHSEDTSGFFGRLLAADNVTFARRTAEVDAFLSHANEVQRLQYERFVVIKEATGNLAFSIVLSGVFWVLLLGLRQVQRNGKPLPAERLALLVFVFLLLVFSFKMHLQHSRRQYGYAIEWAGKSTPSPSPVPSPTPEK